MLISRTTDAKSTTVHTYVPSCVVTGIKIVHSPFSNEESVFPLPSDRRRWVLRHTTSATTGDRVRKCSYLYTSWEHASSAFPVQTKTGLCAIVNASTCDDLPQSPRYCVSTMFVATTTCLRFLRSSGHKRPRDVCKKLKIVFLWSPTHTTCLDLPTYLLCRQTVRPFVQSGLVDDHAHSAGTIVISGSCQSRRRLNTHTAVLLQ